MTIDQAIATAAARLALAGVDNPTVDSELLVAHVLGVARGRLRRTDPLTGTAATRLEALIARRAAREPLQLLIGSVGFRHLDVLVAAGVFIPRPETEVLAGLAIERTPPGGVVVEPCTGTGAVACAVATEGAAALVVATDADPAAVALARANATRVGADVTVRLGDLLSPCPEVRGRIDVLVGNPPYLTAAELAATQPEVREWDPPAALVAGPTGHEVSDRLIAAAWEWLTPGGWLVLEVDERRGAPTAERARAAGLSAAAVHPDLAGRRRFVTARTPCRP